MKKHLVTIVEHANYIKRAEKLLTSEQMDEVANILAVNPNVGEVLQGTGGCRKLRYAGVQGRGKSGGMRVIYLFVTADQHIHLLDIYGKGEKANITKEQKNILAKLAAILKGE